MLLKMRDVMSCRGPDDAGIHIEGNIGLGSRRLSIIDLSERGRMPMVSVNNRYVIVYNGEIYNHPKLRADLKSKGWSFRSNTDTEVILALFTEMGSEMLEILNGMFAMAIWDQLDQSLFLARDRLGIKPLYYSVWQGRLFFASELKSILAAGVPRKFDHSCWGELLAFRYLAGESTPYNNIKELLPGHYLIVQNEKIHKTRWWNLSTEIQAQRKYLPRNEVEWFRHTFDDAVKIRRISDVPLGVLLSGGLDSSSLAASLAIQAESERPNSFTVRFEDDGVDEGPLAKDLAKKWNLQFHELSISPDILVSLLYEAIKLNDEPLAHGNEAHILAISRFSKSLVTVLLSGEGADEVLGGYVRYRPLLFSRWLEVGAPAIKMFDRLFDWQGRLHKLARFLEMGSIDDFILFNASDIFPQDLESIGLHTTIDLEFRRRVLSEAKQIYPGEPVRQAMYLDQHTFLVSELDRIDRMTMGASIEARVPFLDNRLVEMAGAMSTQTHFQGLLGKQLLRKSFAYRLTSPILKNPKWGFGVPWKHYFRSIPELRDVIVNLHTQMIINDGPFDLKKIRLLSAQYLKGDDTNNALVQQLAMIALWWHSVQKNEI